jgi:hypothetical protein
MAKKHQAKAFYSLLRVISFLIVWFIWWEIVPELFYKDVGLTYVAEGEKAWPLLLVIILMIELLMRNKCERHRVYAFIIFTIIAIVVFPIWSVPVIAIYSIGGAL